MKQIDVIFEVLQQWGWGFESSVMWHRVIG